VRNILIEFDLAGAEWVVVAYLTGDENMLKVVQGKDSPHIVTGSFMTGAPRDIVMLDHKIVGSITDPTEIDILRAPYPEIAEACKIFLPRSMSIRQAGKKSNHGLNYDMKYRRFALENEVAEAEALDIVASYRRAYPGIGKWHEAIQKELRDNDRVLMNCFGRKVRLLDEWGPELFDAAYSFKPQSTIGDITLQGMCEAYEDERPHMLLADLLTQTHDSVTYQYPVDHMPEMAMFMDDMTGRILRPELEYNGQKFFIEADMKIGLSWGRMESFKWNSEEPAIPQLERAYAKLLSQKPDPQRDLQTALDTEAEQDASYSSIGHLAESEQDQELAEA
jgi:hypothetical protein